ncbi:MAG: hypothetical protein ACTMIR_08665 [Cellulomonadaceae bacterium]
MTSVGFGSDPLRVSGYVIRGAGFPVHRVFLPLHRADDHFRALSAGVSWAAALGGIRGDLNGMARRSLLRAPHGPGYVGAGGEVPAGVIRSLLRAVRGVGPLDPVCSAHWRGYAETAEVMRDSCVTPGPERLGPWNAAEFVVTAGPLREVLRFSEEESRHFPCYVWAPNGQFSIGMPFYGDSLVVAGGLATHILAQDGVECAQIEADGGLPIEG